jgi:DNA-directed RNA polymerase III subunit RPC8
VLVRELNKKYANRVLHDVGLCVTVFDLAKCSEGKVRYGDGCLWYKGKLQTTFIFMTLILGPVEFRLVVFKPFVSEVLIGKVESSTEEGIRGTSILSLLP